MIQLFNENKPCPFCNVEREIILETEMSFAIYDAFPVNEGHALIIPKRHTANYFDLTNEEQADCFELLNRVKFIVQEKYNPAGFNVGININEAAGQTVPHVHIHLIPRYEGDVEEPRGGVRGVVPGRRHY
ncbi:MAG: HIT family protein [Bacteroidota bacterium]